MYHEVYISLLNIIEYLLQSTRMTSVTRSITMYDECSIYYMGDDKNDTVITMYDNRHIWRLTYRTRPYCNFEALSKRR